jgi:16S rRNA (guanine527-N7)-methyltransferase
MFHVKSDGVDIAATVAGFTRRWSLPPNAAERLERLVEMVGSDGSAPTTVLEPTRVLEDHLADSLVALELRDVLWHEAEIADLGAGAGFPGLPLAIALPGSRLSLVESNARKCQFLERAATTCDLDNVEVVRERAELWRAGIDHCDVVVARALAPLAVVAEYAAPLLRVGGSLVAWRGRRDPTDEAAALSAAPQLGLELRETVAVRPYPAAKHRHLHVLVKVAETPSKFPRRPGVARKHPLGR